MKTHIFLVIFTLGIQALGLNEDEALSVYTSLSEAPAKKEFLNATERHKLWRGARFHKVAALEWLPKYDPSGLIGFCFGRAMTVHLMARKIGLQDSAVKKLFIIGDLRQGATPEWRFHVTTLVKGEDSRWWAVDPIMEPPLALGGPLKMEDWMRIVSRTWDQQGRAHFYLVDNSTVIPDLREVPEVSMEKGEKLIELSFDPKLQSEGFTERFAGQQAYFEVDKRAQHEFLMNTFEINDNDRFKFLGLTINGEFFDYNNYFADLLTELKNESNSPMGGGMPNMERFFPGRDLSPFGRSVERSLYSPRLESLLSRARYR